MRLLQVNPVRGEVEVNQVRGQVEINWVRGEQVENRVRGQQVVTQYIISVKHAAYATGNNNNHFLFMINLINYTIYLTKGRELKKKLNIVFIKSQ